MRSQEVAAVFLRAVGVLLVVLGVSSYNSHAAHPRFVGGQFLRGLPARGGADFVESCVDGYSSPTSGLYNVARRRCPES